MTVVTNAVTTVKSSTVRLTPLSSSRGMSAGLSVKTVLSAAPAATTPTRPPAHAMRAASVSNCRIGTPRRAPRAARTAISRRRAAPRANIKPATFPQAMSSTRTTAAISSQRICRAGPKMKSRSGVTTIRKFDRSMRYSSATPLRYNGISLRASEMLTPLFSRPTA